MYNILDLTNITDYVEYEGLVLIHSYQKKLDDSKRPLNGELKCQGKTLKFKVWDAHIQGVLNKNEIEGQIALITGKGGSYNGVKDITIESIRFDHGFTDLSAFLKAVDVEGTFAKFASFINSNLSQNAVALISNLFTKEGLMEPFKQAWAAKKMHDAQIGGLMNHTVKMLNIAKTLVDNDPRVEPYKDIIYVGIIVHDIGKVQELDNFGNYTKNSFAGHRTIGVEIMARNKELFLQHFDEEFYYHILEILTGHHGEAYGDEPKTVWAYVVHLIDMLDSQLTGIMDAVSVNDIVDQNGNNAVWHPGKTVKNLVL